MGKKRTSESKNYKQKKRNHNARYSKKRLKQNIIVFFRKANNICQYSSWIGLTVKMRPLWAIVISLITSILIIAINYSRTPQLPLFPVFLSLFYLVLALSYYSITMSENNYKKLDKLLLADSILVKKKIRGENMRYTNKNCIFHLLSFYVFLLPLCCKSDTDKITLWVCFLALFIIVNVSIIGYTQYIYFIRFVHSIAKEDRPIIVFNEDDPNNTEWLVSIAQNAQKYSVMFFVVGMCYILLFYIYSMSGLFAYARTLNAFIIVQAAWLILVMGIVIAYPITSALVVKDIKVISKKLKTLQLKKLKRRREAIKDEAVKNSYTSIILLLNRAPEYPIKILLSSIFSGAIEVVNVVAAIISIIPIHQTLMTFI